MSIYDTTIKKNIIDVIFYLILVQKCAELLSKAKKPVFILGSQVTLPPIPAEKLCAALEVMFLSFLFVFKFLQLSVICMISLESLNTILLVSCLLLSILIL